MKNHSSVLTNERGIDRPVEQEQAQPVANGSGSDSDNDGYDGPHGQGALRIGGKTFSSSFTALEDS